MLCQLEIQGLDKCLEESDASTDAKDVKADDKDKGKAVASDSLKMEKDRRCKNLICMSVNDTILRKIMKEPTALAVWKALERDYQTKALPNRIYLKQRFASFKMEENKGIEENLNDFLKLVDDLESLKISISDEDQAIQILSSLPPKYEQLVHTLKYGTGKDTLTVNEVVSSAYAKEIELKEKGLLNRSRSNSEGLLVSSRGRSNQRFDKQGRGRSKSRPRSQSRPKNSKGCWICGKDGHWKRECPERKKKNLDSVNIASIMAEPLVIKSTRDPKEFASIGSINVEVVALMASMQESEPLVISSQCSPQ